MKISLVQSPSWSVLTPPYSLALLAAVLKKEGHEVFCFDFNSEVYRYAQRNKESVSWGTKGESNSWQEGGYVQEFIRRNNDFIEALVSEVLDTQAQIIGFSVQDTSVYFSEEISARIKQKDAKRVIIFGGPSCFRGSSFFHRFLDNTDIDAVCLKEGESAILDFVSAFSSGSQVDYCPGFVSRGNTGQASDAGDVALREELDSLPFADFSGFSLERYEEQTLPISTSRGCVNRCLFCAESAYWQKYRFRSAKNICAEMEFQLKRHPHIGGFFFNDSLINGNISMLDELSGMLIRKGLRIRWGGQAALRREMSLRFMKRLKKSGLSHVSYGLESASPKILRLMGKGFDLKTAQEIIRNTHALGIYTTVNIIVGFPGEGEREVLETADFLRRNIKFMDNIYFHLFVVSPGSYLYDYRNNFNIVLPDVNGPNLWYTQDGGNNYKIRLDRLNFYRSILNDKFATNISLPNYYLVLGDNYFLAGDYGGALRFYEAALDEGSGEANTSLVEDRIKEVNKKINVA
ncbi:MAG: radical SAM protein [Candidatus Omnitrophota bacterium]